MPITRRNMLGLLSSSTFFLTVAPGSVISAELPSDAPTLKFPQGVASGDPQPDGIMLWTRAVPAAETNTPVHLLLQVSSNHDFSTLLLQENIQTDADSDYTVRTYIDGLAPDTHYYYRFIGADKSVSRTGRTRTAPSPGQASKVNLAFVSCQSFEQGYYGSWARMLKEDRAADTADQLQFVLHLGDFIYERCWKERLNGTALSRIVPPFPNGVTTDKNRYAVSLADYRHLYKTYLSDPHLQEARANWPFICIWDDHEFANDNFQGFSTYDDAPVLQAQRKMDANQAWFEFIPAVLNELGTQPAHDFEPQVLGEDEAIQNQAALNSLRIYRKLSWGKYVDIVLTDTRSYRSAPCLPHGLSASMELPLDPVELVSIADAGSVYNEGNPPKTLPFGDGTVPNPAQHRAPGSMLGLEQRDWFLETIKTSTAPWKLWGNAMPLLPMRLDMSTLPFAGYHDSVFNIDGWAGYPFELSVLMRYLEEENVSGLVSLSGDHHMQGAGTIRQSTTAADAPAVAVDFNVAGISSSPLFEDLIAVAKEDHTGFGPLVYRETEDGTEPVWNVSMLSGVLAAFAYGKTGSDTLTDWLGPNSANPGLQYVDTTANGYGLASFDADEMQVQLITMEDCQVPFIEPPGIRHIAKFHLPHWSAGEPPVLDGPDFERAAPFPFQAPAV